MHFLFTMLGRVLRLTGIMSIFCVSHVENYEDKIGLSHRAWAC